MPELAIDRGFLPAYAKLQRPVQRAVDAAIGKFAEHAHGGLRLKKLAQARDPNIRTIRIDHFYRGVVLALGDEQYALLTVLPHDDAIAYAVSRRFTVNQVLGVLEVRDQSGLDKLAGSMSADISSGLFEGVSTVDLTRLGIDAAMTNLIRAISTEEQLNSLGQLLPEVQADVLNGLASGMPVEEVWNELADRIVAGVDTDDLLTAARRTPERITFVSGPHELAAILAHPFDVWRTFLHPTQRDIAYHETYGGPVLVTGSAGTGKTVTGIHRAAHLAGRLPDDGSKVLLTTFTRALADALKKQLFRLTSDRAVLARIEVISIDRLAYQLVAAARKQIKIADEDTLRQLWSAAARDTTSYWNQQGNLAKFSGTFLRREWEQVVLAQQLTSLEAYRNAPRRGRGEVLRSGQREQVWAAINSVVAELAKRREYTHIQLADEAAGIARKSPGRYRHVVVDEGQDLHPAQWRLLRALVEPGPNDMFLLADPYQRIYDSQVSLAQLGIEVRGRSRRLTINYRTTHEILDWSVRVLHGTSAVGLNDEADTLRGYRAITRGGAPVLAQHDDRDAEFEALIEQVGTWLEQGVEPHAIGVAARSGHLVKAITTALSSAYIPVADDDGDPVGVHVATMHRMKGLEFQCVAAVGLDATVLPAANAVTAATEDPLAHSQDLQRERCLLFVALTRARDVLYLSHSGMPSTLLPEAP